MALLRAPWRSVALRWDVIEVSWEFIELLHPFDFGVDSGPLGGIGRGTGKRRRGAGRRGETNKFAAALSF